MEEKPSLDQIFHAIKLDPSLATPSMLRKIVFDYEYEYGYDYDDGVLDILKLRPDIDPKPIVQGLIDDNIYNWALKYIKEFNLNKDDFKWPEKLEKVAEEKKKVCAWCNKVIKEGTEPASHTICPDCSKKELEKRKQRVSDDVLHSNLLEKIVKEYNEEVAIEVDKYLCGEIKEPSRELYSVLTKIGIARLA